MRRFSLVLVILVVALAAVGVLASALAPGKYAVGKDLAPGWYSVNSGGSSLSAVFLPSGCTVNIADDFRLVPAEVKSFTLEAGIYVVGKQVPPGLYSIEAMEENFANYRIDNAEGRRVLGGVVDFDRNGRIGSVELLDGFTVEFDRKVRFGPAGGIQFD